MSKRKNTLTTKQRVFTVVIVTAAVLILGLLYAFVALRGIGVPCFIKSITGVKCPGCGISRTILAILTFKFDKVFSYNLIWPLIVFYLLWVYFFCARSYIKKGRPSYDSPTMWVDIAMLVILLVWWIVRNILGI